MNAVFYFQSLTARYSARNHNLELHVTPSSNIMPIGYLGGLNDIINDNDPINIQNNPVIVNFNNIDTVPNGTLVGMYFFLVIINKVIIILTFIF